MSYMFLDKITRGSILSQKSPTTKSAPTHSDPGYFIQDQTLYAKSIV